MLDDTPEAHQAVKRILDYCSDSTPWTRRLWRLGTVLELEELVEAWSAKHQGALNESAVRYLADGLTKRVKRDPGMGSVATRGQLVGYLNKPWWPGGHDLQAAEFLTAEAKPDYLLRWAEAARLSPQAAEPLARAVAAHLLDIGFSATALHKWFTFHRSHSSHRLALADLLEEAASLSNRPHIRFQMLAPVIAAPSLASANDEQWLSPKQVSEWLKFWHPAHASLRQAGGLLLELDARDVYAAATSARAIVERLAARFRVGTRKRLDFHGTIYVIGEDQPLPLQARPRRVEVHALERTSAVFQLRLPAYIDAALELLEPLDLGAPAAAVAGSWAAIESLLVGPGDTQNRVVAATRMARLVASSYLRAEFTALANAHATTSDDEAARQLRAMRENKDRALHMERLFREGCVPVFERNRHRAAALRMREVIDDPAKTLPRIVGQLEDSFRRLYRQRNLIVHAGLTSSVALEGCLRTTALLIGAGTDRVVHASAAHGIPPLALAALADVRIEQARAGAGQLAEMLP